MTPGYRCTCGACDGRGNVPDWPFPNNAAQAREQMKNRRMRAQLDAMPIATQPPGANEFARMQDAYRAAEEPTCGLAALGKALADYAQACDEADRAEIERINLRRRG